MTATYAKIHPSAKTSNGQQFFSCLHTRGLLCAEAAYPLGLQRRELLACLGGQQWICGLCAFKCGDKQVNKSNDTDWISRVYKPAESFDLTDAIRLHIHLRDGHRCQVTGCTAKRKLEVHHIIPRAMGGTADPDNLILLCRKHHDEIEEATQPLTRAEIRAWGSDDEKPRKHVTRTEEVGTRWQEWVYGGMRNPNK